MKIKMIYIVLLFVTLLLVSCGRNEHIVTFMVNDEIYQKQIVVEDMQLIYPEDPEIDNYFFMGWYTETDEIISGAIKNDITLYAQFIQEPYAYFDVNIGNNMKELDLTNFINEISKKIDIPLDDIYLQASNNFNHQLVFLCTPNGIIEEVYFSIVIKIKEIRYAFTTEYLGEGIVRFKNTMSFDSCWGDSLEKFNNLAFEIDETFKLLMNDSLTVNDSLTNKQFWLEINLNKNIYIEENSNIINKDGSIIKSEERYHDWYYMYIRLERYRGGISDIWYMLEDKKI